jgi:radical SAM protein with 4Fe4S-binding SPASM domain
MIKEPQPRCYVPWQEMMIAADGNVAPCTYYQGFGNKFGRSCGNVNEDSILGIWNGSEYQRLRRFMLSPEGAEGCPGCLATKQGLQGYLRMPNEAIRNRCERLAGYPYAEAISFLNLQEIISEIREKKMILNGKPSRISYTPSHHCNFSCRMCYQSANRSLKLKAQKRVDQEITDLIPFLIELVMGGGEPFIQPFLIRLMEQFHPQCSPLLSFAATTNGSRVSEEVRRKLLRFPQVQLIFSLDGTSLDVFEFIRGEGHYKEVMANLGACIRLRDELGSEFFSVGGNMTVMRSNFHQVPEMIRFMANQRLSVNFQPLNCYPYDERIDVFRNPREDLKRFRAYLDEAEGLFTSIPELRETPFCFSRSHIQALKALIPFELLQVQHFPVNGEVPLVHYKKNRALYKSFYDNEVPQQIVFFGIADERSFDCRYWAPIEEGRRFTVSMAQGEYIAVLVPRNVLGFPMDGWRIRVSPASLTEGNEMPKHLLEHVENPVAIVEETSTISNNRINLGYLKELISCSLSRLLGR